MITPDTFAACFVPMGGNVAIFTHGSVQSVVANAIRERDRQWREYVETELPLTLAEVPK